MKAGIILLLTVWVMSMILVACNGAVYQPQQTDIDSVNVQYPTATQYATTLYAASTQEKEGEIRRIADHFVLTGDTKLIWNKDIAEEGEYDVVIQYASDKEGATVEVLSGIDSLSDQVEITKGIYQDTEEWHKKNFERKLIGESLHLSAGLNSISLQINTPEKDFEMDFFALELIPITYKTAAIKEVKKAITSRPATDWFSSMRYGIMLHWTSQSAPRTGTPKTYQEAVNDFDVDAFVDMVEKTGADYVIFTGNHAEPHFPAPLKKWAVEYPEWTTERDLIAEISEALGEKDIRFILYLATHIYARQDQLDIREFERLNSELLSEIGERYKEKIAGYWLDGFYQSYQSHPDFDFEKFYKISKAGNAQRLLALNSWLYPIVSEWQDYWAGEIYSIGAPPHDRIITSGPGKGLPYHALLVMENDWVHTKINTPIPSPRLDTEALIEFITSAQGKGPVTVNLGIYQDGSIGEEALNVMEKIKLHFKN